jgi:hypothetical protein
MKYIQQKDSFMKNVLRIRLFNPTSKCLISVGNQPLQNGSFFSKSYPQETLQGSSVTLITDCDLNLMGSKSTYDIQTITKPLEAMEDIEDLFFVFKASSAIVHFMAQLSIRMPVLLYFISHMQCSSNEQETLLWENYYSQVKEVIIFMIKSLGGDMDSRQIVRDAKASFKRQVICDVGILDRIFISMLKAPFSHVDFDFSYHSPQYRFMERMKSNFRQTIRLTDVAKHPKLKKILGLIYDCFKEFLKEDINQSQIYIARNLNIFIGQLSPALKADELLEKIVSNNPLIISCLQPTHIESIVDYLTQNGLQSRMLDFLSSICSGI